MARPRQFNEAAVKAALRNVFWERGYEGASYADIMSATGLNKGSLYASFGDKRALYHHAISDYTKSFANPGVIMLQDTDPSPKNRIRNLMDGLVQAAQTPEGRWGCLLCNAAIDQAPCNADVEKTVSDAISRFRKAIRECVKGTLAENKSDLIWTAYFGGHVMVKAGYSKAIMRTHKKQVLSLFD